MSILTNNHLTRLSFSIYENRGVYAFLVGSGLSRAAEIPTGWEITIDLIRRLARAQGEEEQPDWVDWYRERTGEEPDYTVLVGELGSSRDERRSILDSYIEPTTEDREEGRKLPTVAHYAIAELVQLGFVRVIISTNFDRLLESALRERGIEPTVVASVDALKGAEPLTHSNCYLLKLHGDYKDARILNTETELSQYPPEYDALLDRIFDEHGLVVCGWSGEWDHGLRDAILRSPNRRYSVFWAARGELGAGAEELVAHRKGIQISIADADKFLVEIRNRVENLARTHRQNPQSIDLLVSTTKRYLSKAEHHIQLNDLLTSEARSLVEKLEAEDFSTHGNWNVEEFRRRMAIYEATSEPLAQMVGVLGRWGTDSEVTMVMDIVRFVCSRVNEVKGELANLIGWINLLTYPAVLLVTAYGIGLVRSQRWHALHLFLSSEIEDKYRGEPKRVVESLFLWSWGGGNDDYWRMLEGMDHRKTPLSDHLCELFGKWSESSVGVISSFEELYETWEVLGSLTSCESYTLEQLQAAISKDSESGCELVPIGRSGWHDQTRHQIIRHIQSDEIKQDLLKAGFGKGQADFFEVAIGNFMQCAGRMQRRY